MICVALGRVSLLTNSLFWAYNKPVVTWSQVQKLSFHVYSCVFFWSLVSGKIYRKPSILPWIFSFFLSIFLLNQSHEMNIFVKCVPNGFHADNLSKTCSDSSYWQLHNRSLLQTPCCVPKHGASPPSCDLGVPRVGIRPPIGTSRQEGQVMQTLAQRALTSHDLGEDDAARLMILMGWGRRCQKQDILSIRSRKTIRNVLGNISVNGGGKFMYNGMPYGWNARPSWKMPRKDVSWRHGQPRNCSLTFTIYWMSPFDPPIQMKEGKIPCKWMSRRLHAWNIHLHVTRQIRSVERFPKVLAGRTSRCRFYHLHRCHKFPGVWK